MRAVLVLALQVLLCLAADGAGAADRRVALVIGNGAYAHATRLPNPSNDAAAVAAALRRIGFAHVREAGDLGADAMRRELALFSAEAAKADIALVFFAGHGIEVDGQNYLIPTDARLADAALVEIEAIPLATVTSVIAGASRLRLVILDACRNNPFRSRMESATGTRKRSIGRGLARVEPGENELIAFAAAGGTEADDGSGRHSPFTAALLKSLETPGLEVRLLFGAVRDDVLEATRRRQTPHVYGTLGRAQIYLGAVAAAGPPIPPAPTSPKADDGSADLIAAIEGLSDRERLAAFARHRNAAVAKAAADRLASLAPAPAPVPPAPADAIAALVPGSGKSARDCPECPEMVVVPAGSFMMGSPATEAGRDSNEGPQRKVTIARPFAVGKFEATFEEWAACVAGGGCASNKEPGDGGWGKGRRPVINVSWDHAKEYVAWLSRKTGKAYRLLTEAEWEYAARGVTSANARHPRYWWGDTASHEYANYGADACCSGLASGRDQWAHTAPVGSFPANPFGLHDMHGNVWEWVEDCYISTYDNAPADGSVVPATSGCSRVLRGGGWVGTPRFLRSGNRNRGTPEDRNGNLGFRLARTITP